MDTVRVDRWLWAVRVFKTRTMAADACRGGHVRINGTRAKPASSVKVGDRVEVRGRAGWQRIVEVARVIDARVGPPIARECLIDHTPPRPAEEAAPGFGLPRVARGAGRPSKRELRALDRLRGRRPR